MYLIFFSYETSTQSFLLEDPTIYFLDPSPKRKEYVNVLIHFIMHYLYTIHTLFTIIRFIIHYSYTSIHSYKHVFSTLFIHYSLLYTLSYTIYTLPFIPTSMFFLHYSYTIHYHTLYHTLFIQFHKI